MPGGGGPSAQIKDAPTPDGNGHRTTTPGQGPEWVIVYEAGVALRAYEPNVNGQTTSMSVIETFYNETECHLRIGELGFTVPAE